MAETSGCRLTDMKTPFSCVNFYQLIFFKSFGTAIATYSLQTKRSASYQMTLVRAQNANCCSIHGYHHCANNKVSLTYWLWYIFTFKCHISRNLVFPQTFFIFSLLSITTSSYSFYDTGRGGLQWRTWFSAHCFNFYLLHGNTHTVCGYTEGFKWAAKKR